MLVGLTGGIATGKSTASSLFKSRGVPIVDADVLARKVVQPGTSAYKKIVKHFGADILLPDKTIDRAKLGGIIFNDNTQRSVLNNIVHPAVRYAMLREILAHWLRGESICIVDVPLLIEVGLYKWMGKVIVVYCSEELQLQRLKNRDKSTTEAARSRIRSQLAIAEKVKCADLVIDNSGSVHDMEDQIDRILSQLHGDVHWTWRISWVVPPIGVLLALWTLSYRSFIRWRSHRSARKSR